MEANRVELFLRYIDRHRAVAPPSEHEIELIAAQQREIDALAAQVAALRLQAETPAPA